MGEEIRLIDLQEARGVMNFRRGFFRLWLLFSALFVVLMAALFYQDVKREFQDAAFEEEITWDEVPVACRDARGMIVDDYQLREYGGKHECFYTLPKFRVLYPEYKDLTDQQLSDRLYDKAGYPGTHASPWALVSKAASIGLGVPVIVLAVGAALRWCFAGFSFRPGSSSK